LSPWILIAGQLKKKEKKYPLISESNTASTSFEVLRVEFWRIPFFCNMMET
jgi:hypothetical protein